MTSEKELREGLSDAGCCGEDIEQILESYQKNDLKKGMKIIGQRRKQLLEEVHEGQRRIDCLDYLVYQMSK